MTDALAVLDRATQMLAEVRTVDDGVYLINLAEAARVYAKKIGLDLEDQNRIAEIKIRTQRKTGEILQVMKDKGERQTQGEYQKFQDETFDIPPKLDDLGISRVDAHRWQYIAQLPDDKFEKKIAVTKKIKKELTTSDIYKEAKNYVIESRRGQMAAEVADIPQDIDLLVGDFRDVLANFPENSIDLIFTDPPYDEETIPLYGDLARLGARVLKPGGSLIAYAGHYALPRYFELMTPHLRYWWILALFHDGAGGHARLPGKHVYVEWKPLLWFVKERRYNNEYIADKIVTHDQGKDYHEWQQSIEEADYLINHLTDPGGVVLDPFAGSGTTLVAAKKNHRQSIGIELDAGRASAARKRIADYFDGNSKDAC